MSRRGFAVVYTVIAVAALALPAAAGAQDANRRRRAPAWGDPDLQGIWNNATLTPFQRPERAGQRRSSSRKRRRPAIEQQTADRNVELLGGARAAAPRRAATSGPTTTSGWSGGRTVVPTRRTSVITDPPNGRLPEVTRGGRTAWLNVADEAELIGPGDAATATCRPPDLRSTRPGRPLPLVPRRFRPSPPATTTTTTSCRTPTSCSFCRSTSTTCGSFRIDGRPAHLRGVRPAVRGELARPLGGRHPGRRNHPTSTTRRSSAISTTWSSREELARGGGTLHARHRAGNPRLRVHSHRPERRGRSPWQGSLPMSRNSEPLYEYACHEGNYGLFNIMAGSRAEEAAAAK